MVLAMVGDYLLGTGTIGQSASPEAIWGIEWNVAPDWRYAVSSILGFCCAALFAVAAVEALKVLETKYQAKGIWYKLFKLGNWAGILYFAFIHIGICMLPVVFNAGYDATGGDTLAAARMVMRVTKSIIVPMGFGFIACDGLVTAGWMGLVFKGGFPLKKWMFILTPLTIALIGQAFNLIPLPFEGVDSGFESFGWLLMYAAMAKTL